jgi:pyrroline-5-carboxylate reductase
MRIGFAGAGNMAAAMARGWARVEEGETAPTEAMVFADAGSGRAVMLAEEVSGEAVSSIGELPGRSDVIVLAVKRTALDQVAAELGGDLPPVISVLAGVPGAKLQERFPDTRVLRAVPNVAVEVRRGVTCYVPWRDRHDEVERTLTGLLGHLGAVCAIQDDLIDPATAVMSCSPAYMALLSETLARAGEDAGLERSLAHELVVDSLAGTAELLRSRDPAAIRHAVASPGGATEAGLDALARRDLESAVQEAVAASLERMRA